MSSIPHNAENGIFNSVTIFMKGYRMLTLGWSDENSLVPVTIACCQQPMIKICFAKRRTSMDVLLHGKCENNSGEKQQRLWSI